MQKLSGREAVRLAAFALLAVYDIFSEESF